LLPSDSNAGDAGDGMAFPKNETTPGSGLRRKSTLKDENEKSSLAKKLMEKMKAAPPMTTRT